VNISLFDQLHTELGLREGQGVLGIGKRLLTNVIFYMQELWSWRHILWLCGHITKQWSKIQYLVVTILPCRWPELSVVPRIE